MSNTTFPIPLELREALNIPNNTPVTPHDRRRTELVEFAKGLQAIPVPPQLKVDEAASLFEFFGKDRALNEGT